MYTYPSESVLRQVIPSVIHMQHSANETCDRLVNQLSVTQGSLNFPNTKI